MKLPELPEYMREATSDAAFNKTATVFREVAQLRGLNVSSMDSLASPLSPTNLLEEQQHLQVFVSDLNHGRVITSTNIKYKTIRRAVNELSSRHNKLQTRTVPPKVEDDDVSPVVLLEKETPGERLVYLMTKDDDVYYVNESQFCHFFLCCTTSYND